MLNRPLKSFYDVGYIGISPTVEHFHAEEICTRRHSGLNSSHTCSCNRSCTVRSVSVVIVRRGFIIDKILPGNYFTLKVWMARIDSCIHNRYIYSTAIYSICPYLRCLNPVNTPCNFFAGMDPFYRLGRIESLKFKKSLLFFFIICIEQINLPIQLDLRNIRALLDFFDYFWRCLARDRIYDPELFNILHSVILAKLR